MGQQMSKSSKNRLIFKFDCWISIIIFSKFYCFRVKLNFLIVFQIASLKAALARKEGESEHSLSGSSEKYRTRAGEVSPYHANQRGADIVSLGCRQPMLDVGNIEVCIFHFRVVFCF